MTMKVRGMGTEGGKVDWKDMESWGQNNLYAFYFLFVNIFKSKKNSADISIFFLCIWPPVSPEEG